MATVSNKIAGQDLEHLAALSDGVFAIAMTLLALDLHVPAARLTVIALELDRAKQIGKGAS